LYGPAGWLRLSLSSSGLRAFPASARREAGYQLDQVQSGREPDDWKPMPTVGQGVQEIRIGDAAGAFRVIYVAKFSDAVYVCIASRRRRRRPAKRIGLSRETLSEFGEGVRPMTNERFASVWDAIEDTPAQAENMKLRSALMIALKDHIAREGLSQSQAAKVFGVTQPRVSDLMRGKIDLFGLDTLVNMLAAAGLHIEMRVLEAA
jgi:predicted XRE-type DNA-binding protein/phage-related protein